MKYLVSFFDGLNFGHEVFRVDELSEKSVSYIASQLQEQCDSDGVVIIGITKLDG